ncbi:MAG: RdgB/HAM1 family non-canonical purine NTP pyrophosphatase [Oscillospiraceae bacterium]|nr:RdgB/HAM1 family non-canonical purine NTP pyrophosphatase [Oscillospiraceae bacterium]
MDIVLASRNIKKIGEMETLLREHMSYIKVLSLDDINYQDEIEETGATFEENALIKASLPAKLGYIGIADDSGLEVDILNGRPGINSSRYSGENASDNDNNDKLLLELLNIPVERRTSRFVCAIACVFPYLKNAYFTVRGTCEGYIIDNPRGSNGFGYDPLFLCKEYDQTFAELTDEQKNLISHRGNAVQLFIQEFSKHIEVLK